MEQLARAGEKAVQVTASSMSPGGLPWDLMERSSLPTPGTTGSSDLTERAVFWECGASSASPRRDNQRQILAHSGVRVILPSPQMAGSLSPIRETNAFRSSIKLGRLLAR